MRRICLALALLCATLAVAVFWLRGSETPPVATQPVPPEILLAEVREEPPPPRQEPVVLESPNEQARVEIVPEPTVASTREEAVQEPSEEPAAACVLIGTIEDGHGNPVPGVLLRLRSSRYWAKEQEISPIEDDLYGFNAQTDSMGSFRFEVPAPTNPRTWLSIDADLYHAAMYRQFDSRNASLSPSLRAGLRDLGTLHLPSTGAFRGRVTNEMGTPLSGVRVSVDTPYSKHHVTRGTRTAEDGTYLLGHAPAGSYPAMAWLEGYLRESRVDLIVRTRETTRDIDFILKTAPTLTGRVTDEEGNPLQGVDLRGSSRNSGKLIRGTTNAQGEFTISLPQEDHHELRATLDGYEPWGDYKARFSPGQKDIEIVMKTMPRTQFLVLDHKTRAPIESFALRIYLDSGSGSEHAIGHGLIPTPIRHHPGGICEASGRPRIDQVHVRAEGYMPLLLDVKPKRGDIPKQTIRMRRGGSVSGRLLSEGEPAGNVLIELLAGSYSYGRVFEPNYDARRHETMTDAEGRFTVELLKPRRYRLTANPQGEAPVEFDLFKLRIREQKDLGDLELNQNGASIVGMVRLPSGIQPEGLIVILGGRAAGRRALLSDESRFRFDNVPAGEHSLYLDHVAGKIAATRPLPVTCVAEETLHVVIDARDRVLTQVKLTLALADLDVQGVGVELINAENPEESAMLGKCDATGLVAGTVRGWGPTRVRLWPPGFRDLEFAEADLILHPNEEIEYTIRRAFAQLRIPFPAGFEFPEDGELTVDLETKDADAVQNTMVFETAGDSLLDSSSWAWMTADALFVGGLTAGSYRLAVDLSARVSSSRAGSPPAQRATHEFHGETDILLEAGELVSAELY